MRISIEFNRGEEWIYCGAKSIYKFVGRGSEIEYYHITTCGDSIAEIRMDEVKSITITAF